MSRHLNLAVLPGDGIGPEITQQAVRVLERLAAQGHFSLTLEQAPVGGAGYRASSPSLARGNAATGKIIRCHFVWRSG